MRAIVKARLKEERFAPWVTGLAAGLWLMAVALSVWDVLGRHSHEPSQWTLLAGLMATSALMLALTGTVVRALRVEHEVTRLLSSALAARSSSSEALRDLLLRDARGEVVDVRLPRARGTQ